MAAAPATSVAATSEAAAPNPPLLISPPPLSWAAVVSGQVAGAPASPRTHAKSFHGVLDTGKIKQKSSSSYKGEPAVFFSNEEIKNLAAPFRYTLVGKFLYQRPKMEIIRKFFISLGLKSLQSVGLLHENHIAIFITTEEDYTRLLLRSIWYIACAPMKVLKWSPEFYPSVESPVVPVWVGLPGLPLHLFEKSALFCIASVLGKPLKTDEPTAKLSRPSVARICIEVDVSKPLNRRIWLGDDKEGYWQDICFENPPQYCDFCKVLGHDHTTCYKKNLDLLKDLKKDSGIEKSKVEKNRSSGVPVDNVEKKNHKEIWRRKNTEAAMVEPNDAEDWIVVGGKKKHKSHCSTLKEEIEMMVGDGKQKCGLAETFVMVPEEAKFHEDVGGKVTTAVQANILPESPVILGKSKKAKAAEADENGRTVVSRKEQGKRKLIFKVTEKEIVVPTTQEKEIVGGTSSVVVWRKKDEKEIGKTDQSIGLSAVWKVSDPSGSNGKVVVDVVEILPDSPSISQIGKPPAAFFHKAIALTPLPDMSKFKNKNEVKFCDSNKSEPSKPAHISEFQCGRMDCSEFNGSLSGSGPLVVNEKSQPLVSLGLLGDLKIQPIRAEER